MYLLYSCFLSILLSIYLLSSSLPFSFLILSCPIYLSIYHCFCFSYRSNYLPNRSYLSMHLSIDLLLPSLFLSFLIFSDSTLSYPVLHMYLCIYLSIFFSTFLASYLSCRCHHLTLSIVSPSAR